jgi:hypothetical protein
VAAAHMVLVVLALVLTVVLVVLCCWQRLH